MTRAWIIALGLLAVLNGGASAQELLLTYGVYYAGTWLTTNGALQYWSQTSPSFSLRLRGLLAPPGGLYADMAATTVGIYGTGTSFAAQSYSLNVFATRPTSSFLLTWARSHTASSLSAADESATSGDALVTNLGLRPLRDVFVNFQYATTRLETPGVTGTLISYGTTTRLGAFAVLRPITLTFTQSWSQSMQTEAGASSSVASSISNVGLFLDHPLAGGMGLQVSANTGTSRTEDALGLQERTDTSGAVRLMALPIRGLFVEGRVTYDPRLAPGPLLGVGVRAEPWRMVLLDGSYDIGPSHRLWWATLRMVPSSKITVWISASATEQVVDGGLARDRHSLASATLRLSRRADLTVEHFWQETTDPARALQEWSVAYVHRPTPVVTYRLAYRLLDDVQAGVPRQERTLGGDIFWLLSPRASLSLSMQADLAQGAGLSFSSAWLRWAPDTYTDAFLNYRYHQDATGVSTGWSVTLARRLATDASLQFTYDAQSNGAGDRRSIMVVFRNQWGTR
ncbi:MAG: hypothetical protein QN194_15945 [Armatimonadota bacterium]|nr:hypothetical protein [Armatimonadota bacterium]MDR7574406.1 hypothetical protein [Armatimonadota bacterium]MDR7588779.1 hypothetical protein [Armatimonadota bacterium]